jgi:haloalkane dehalogenase
VSDDLLADWAARGRAFEAGGVRSRVWEAGDGEPVLLVHGVPVSAYAYRKVLPELARRGLRAVAVDLPGLGLAERPQDFDYSWSGLAGWLAAAVDVLGLRRFHLVVHDIGGPIGLAAATAMPERPVSVTLLNTMVRVASFRRPPTMEPFAHRPVGEWWLRLLNPLTFPAMLRLGGWVGWQVPARELAVHARLLRDADGGRAFLQIMRGFERTPAFESRVLSTLRDPRVRVQIVWGERDPGLRIGEHGEEARVAAGVARIHRLAASHFVMEDAPAGVGARVAAHARAA